jgi:hypothetical protein
MAQLEEAVAIYKQQIAHLQTVQPVVYSNINATSSTPTINNAIPLPTPTSTAERKNSASPTWPTSPCGNDTSSNDDTRSTQSGDDSSSPSSASSTTSSPSHSPSPTPQAQASGTVVIVPSNEVSITTNVVQQQQPSNDGATSPLPTLSSLPAPIQVNVEDEVNGDAIQRCIQSIITASYPSRQEASSSSSSLMAVAGAGNMPSSSSDSKDDNGNHDSNTALNNQIQGLFDMFAKRTKVTESHLDSLDKLLGILVTPPPPPPCLPNHVDAAVGVIVPSMPLRFLEWSLTQNDKFYSDPNGLWHCLWAKTLALTNEQVISLTQTVATPFHII